jgi:hypothetical protein
MDLGALIPAVVLPKRLLYEMLQRLGAMILVSVVTAVNLKNAVAETYKCVEPFEIVGSWLQLLRLCSSCLLLLILIRY